MENLKNKTKEQLLIEVGQLNLKIAELEKSSSEHGDSMFAEREKSFLALYQNAPISYHSLNADGIFLQVNDIWLKTLGYKKEEVIGKKYQEFLHPESLEIFEKNFPKYKEQGFIHDVPFKLRHKDGYFIDILLDGGIGYTPTGEFKQTYCVFKDITKEQKIEIQLKDSEEKFRGAFEFSPIGKSITKIDGTLEINHAFANMLGYTTEELKSKSWKEITHPDDIQESANIVNSLLEGEITKAQYEKRYFHKNGSIVWTEINTFLKRDKNNKPEYFLTTINDITLKKESAQKIRQTEERYHLLFNLLPYGGEIIDLKGNIIDYSASTAKMLGYEVHELIGKPITKLITPESLISFKKNFPILLSGKPAKAEIQMVHKNGSTLDILRAAQPILDKNGKVESILALNLDITDRKLAENEIKNKEKQFRTIVESAGDSMFLADYETKRIILANQQACKALGYAYEELIGLKVNKLDLVYLSDKEIETLWDSLTINVPITFETKHKRKDGSIFPVEIRTGLIMYNDKKTILGFTRDITERKKAKDKLAIQNQKLSNILEGTNAGTWNWNIQTGAAFFDERWANIMGRSLKELEPTDVNTWINNVHPDDLPMANATLEKHFKGELDYFDVEFRQPHKNGDWVWVNARGKVIEWTKDDKPLQMSGTHLDITDRKKAEEELKKHREQLEELVKERTLEIDAKNKKLADQMKIFVGREMKIRELESKLNTLKGI